MKEVNMYIRGICKNSGEYSEIKEGRYIVLLEYKGRHKQDIGIEFNTTSNRMLLKALIKGIEMLKEPCIINFYTPTSLGFKKPNKSPNKDLINEVLTLVEAKGHKLNKNISMDKQECLIKALKKLDIDSVPKELYEFFKECVGYDFVAVAKNTDKGYVSNGLFNIIDTDKGFELVQRFKGSDEIDFDYKYFAFNNSSIVKYELGVSFGRYANVYINDQDYIHIHKYVMD